MKNAVFQILFVGSHKPCISLKCVSTRNTFGIHIMFKKNKFIISALLAFIASTSLINAETTTWNFVTGSAGYDVDNSGNNFGNQLSIDSDDDGSAELTIEAWASTGCGWSCGNDDEVFQGYASTNAWGLLNYNLDSSNSSLTGENHEIDNKGGDVDMMFFSFLESTALTGIELGWADDSDISIAAFSTLPTLNGSTWSEIAAQSIFSASFNDIGTSPYSLANEISGVLVEAQYWLIGAYSAVFEDKNLSDENDAFKIASITTKTTKKPEPKPPTEVAEPSTFAVLAGFGLFLIWRRKKAM
jgi:hypothetical protein